MPTPTTALPLPPPAAVEPPGAGRGDVTPPLPEKRRKTWPAGGGGPPAASFPRPKAAPSPAGLLGEPSGRRSFETCRKTGAEERPVPADRPACRMTGTVPAEHWRTGMDEAGSICRGDCSAPGAATNADVVPGACMFCSDLSVSNVRMLLLVMIMTFSGCCGGGCVCGVTDVGEGAAGMAGCACRMPCDPESAATFASPRTSHSARSVRTSASSAQRAVASSLS